MGDIDPEGAKRCWKLGPLLVIDGLRRKVWMSHSLARHQASPRPNRASHPAPGLLWGQHCWATGQTYQEVDRIEVMKVAAGFNPGSASTLTLIVIETVNLGINELICWLIHPWIVTAA
jgi:hypothetical protein